MFSACLLLGSNLGDRLLNLSMALEELRKGGIRTEAVSHVYESDPWGFDAPERFLNLAVLVQYEGTPSDLLARCLLTESHLGRVRGTGGYSSRTIDIDILLCGREIINLPELKVPHPAMSFRRFVLVPVVQLIPDEVHPVLNKTMRQLLDACTDKGNVVLFCHSRELGQTYKTDEV